MKNRLTALLATGLIELHGVVVGAASTVEFVVTNYSGAEGTGFNLQLSINPPVMTTNAQVTLVQIGGSADSTDYSFVSPGGTIPIPTTQGQAPAVILLADDGLPESDETIELTLTNPTGGLVLGTNTRVVVTIQNAGPAFALDGGYGNSETNGFAEVSGYRTGDTNLAFTVDFATIANGTAVPGVNFVPTNGTLTVTAGERSISFRLPILNDGVVDIYPGSSCPTFGVYLTNASAGVRISTEPVEIRVWDSQWPTTLDLSYISPVRNLQIAAAVAPDGQIVGLEWDSDNAYRLVRLNADGSLAARSSPVVFDTFSCWPGTLCIQPDGKILVVGCFTAINGVQLPQAGFARLNADASLDTSFHPTTIQGFPFGAMDPGYPMPESLRPLADGRILFSDGTFLHALQANGELDLGFQATNQIRPRALAEDAHGMVIVASEDLSGFTAIVRLNGDGSPDPTFAPALVGRTDDLPRINRIVPQPDGKILIAGAFASVNGVNRADLARLNPNGELDLTFDAALPPDWKSSSGYWNSPAGIRQLALIDDEKILIAYSGGGRCGNWILRRCNADGSLDRQFVVFLCDAYYTRSITAMTLQGGRLLVVGLLGSVNGSKERFTMARLLLDEAPPTAAVISEYGLEGYEGMGEAEITVRRLGDVRGAATVLYHTQDGSANAGQDYTAVAGMLSFAPLEQEKSFRVPLLDDADPEPDETVQLVLGAGTGLAAVGPTNLFTIHDNEVTIRGVQQSGYGDFWIPFNTVPGQTYVLEGSQDLIHWQELQRAVPYGYVDAFLDFPPATLPRRFYRVKVLP